MLSYITSINHNIIIIVIIIIIIIIIKGQEIEDAIKVFSKPKVYITPATA